MQLDLSSPAEPPMENPSGPEEEEDTQLEKKNACILQETKCSN